MYTVFTQAHQSRHNNCSLRAYHTDPLTRLYAQYMLKMKTTRPVLRWWHSIQYCHGSHGPMNLKIKNTAIDHEMKSHWTAGRKKADGCMHLKARTRFQLHVNWNEAPVSLVRVVVEVLVRVLCEFSWRCWYESCVSYRRGAGTSLVWVLVEVLVRVLCEMS